MWRVFRLIEPRVNSQVLNVAFCNHAIHLLQSNKIGQKDSLKHFLDIMTIANLVISFLLACKLTRQSNEKLKASWWMGFTRFLVRLRDRLFIWTKLAISNWKSIFILNEYIILLIFILHIIVLWFWVETFLKGIFQFFFQFLCFSRRVFECIP